MSHDSTPLGDAFQDFLLSCQADGLADATLKHYRSKLGRFVKHFGQQPLAAITTRHIREYIVNLREQAGRYLDAPQKPRQPGKLSQETINTHIRALHRFWHWAAREYDLPNPMQRIRYPQPTKQAPKGVSAADVVNLLGAALDNDAGTRDRALVAFLADTGCRLSGLLSLTLDNLDMLRRRAIVTEKGPQSRIVHFTPVTAEFLRRWLLVRTSDTQRVFVSMNTGQALTDSGVALILKRLKARAGVRGRIHPHGFRHGFARQFIQSGGDIAVLARLLGHANINTTAQFYALFTDNELGEMHHRYSPLRTLSE